MLVSNNCVNLNPHRFYISSDKLTQTKKVNQVQNTQNVSFKGNSIGDLIDFVNKYSMKIPADRAEGNDSNLTFFAVRKINSPSAEEFKNLARPIINLLEDKNKEISYIELNKLFNFYDDQALVLQTIGLGDLLGAWNVSSPEKYDRYMPNTIKKQMACIGGIAISKK